MNIRELLKRSREGDEQAIANLIEIFNPLVNKYSYLFGRKDEDLYSELILAFVRCAKRFHLDECLYVEEFKNESGDGSLTHSELKLNEMK